MTTNGKAYIAGVYEHPTRKADDISLAQLHAEVAKGALEDAGLTKGDVDGYFCAGDAPGLGPLSMADYLGLELRHMDTMATGTAPRNYGAAAPDVQFEYPFGPTVVNQYAMCAMRHMHEFGTTSEQLAWIKVAASHHAQHNPHALLRDVVTVEDVLNSPMISDPLHRMDCCVVTDGGGALIVTSEAIARSLKKPLVRMIGHGEALKGPRGGKDLNLTYSAGVWSGPRAFEEAGVTPKDIKYASIYDSFTITVLMQIEDLGFCRKGEGGKFVADGNLISRVGKRIRRCRCRTAISPSRTAPAACSGFATPHRPAFWSACDGQHREIPDAAGQSGDTTVLGCDGRGQVADQALHRLWRAALLSAHAVPVLLLRQNGVGRKLGRGRDLYLQPDAQVRERSLCDRLRHVEGRPIAADQFRRLRHGQIEDRPEGQGGVQDHRWPAAAVLYAGVRLRLRTKPATQRGRHPRASGDPVNAEVSDYWMPAFAGMTRGKGKHRKCRSSTTS